jgi:thiol-disulfide isomerase/thioredoxin
LKQSKKLIIILVVFVLFIVGSSFLYKGLSQNFAANQKLNIVKQNETKTTEATEKAAATEVAGTASATEKETQPDVSKNQTADFTVLDASKKDFKLSSAFGKPIILNFWASWCPPCKSEMPEFQKAYEQYGSDVQFIMVNLTDGERETIDTASAFVKKQGYTFPVYFDANQDAAYAYQFSSIPATYFIDKDGNIAAKRVGALSLVEMQSYVKQLVDK